MASPSNVSSARSQLMDDFNKIAGDTEALVKAIAAVPGDKASALRASLEANLASARQRVRDIQDNAYESTAAMARATDSYARENPWQMVGVAVAVGFILGLIVSRD